jgi:putative transposase
VQSIYSYCMNERFQYWPLASLYFQMLKDKATVVSLSTFYKYVGLLKPVRKEIKKAKQSIGIRADTCYKILHADITILKTADNIKTYIYLLQDNFSRAILSYRISLEKKAVYTFENVQFVYENYLKPMHINDPVLLTDDGCENYGVVNTFIAGTTIKHLIAQQDIHFSNSMIEAANKQLKYRYLYHKTIPSFNELGIYIKEAVDDFNNRPHAVLKGLTPLEVLSGESNSVITAEIEKAKIDRIIENKKLQCCYSF